MEGKEIARFVQEKFSKEFELSGFQMNVSNDWFRTAVVVSKKNKEVHHSFRFLVEQNTDESPTVYGFWAHVLFPELEQILRGVLMKNNLVGLNKENDEILDSFNVDYKFKNTLPEKGLKLNKGKDLQMLSELCHKFYSEDVLLFFKQWKCLKDLYEFIKHKKDDELWDVLGQFAPMKKAVILRLCNDNRALKFISDYYSEQKNYYEEDSKDIDNIRYYNASEELLEILKETQPLYNLDT